MTEINELKELLLALADPTMRILLILVNVIIGIILGIMGTIGKISKR